MKEYEIHHLDDEGETQSCLCTVAIMPRPDGALSLDINPDAKRQMDDMMTMLCHFLDQGTTHGHHTYTHIQTLLEEPEDDPNTTRVVRILREFLRSLDTVKSAPATTWSNMDEEDYQTLKNMLDLITLSKVTRHQ